MRSRPRLPKFNGKADLLRDDWNIIEDDPKPPDVSDRLNASRIRAIALDRQAASRARQWLVGRILFASTAAVAIMIQAGLWLVKRQHQAAAWLSLIGAVVLLRFAVAWFIRWRRLGSLASKQSDEPAQPTFAELSDGSQQIKRLHDLNND